MLPFLMVSQSQQPFHRPSHRRPLHPRPRLSLSPTINLVSPFNPSTMSHFRTRLSHAAPVSQEKSATCAYIPSPRAWTPCPEQKQVDSARASGVNPSFFSNLQPLSVSLPSFSSTRPLFSAAYSLFSESTRVGGGPGLRTFGINGQPLFRIVGSRGFVRTLRRSKRKVRQPA